MKDANKKGNSISVIVPVYNTEKYLRRCVDSILAQTFTDFELLLINDGSTDSSGAICDEYAQKDSRVRVFHKENGGVSSARNLGLDNAKGEYIAFVDSDDYIDNRMYECLYNKAIEDDSDIVYSDIRLIFGENSKYYKMAKFSDEKNAMMKNYITHVWTVIWNMIVKKEIYSNNALYFPQGVSYCEDFWLSVRLMHYAKKISHIDEAFYNYYLDNGNSCIHNLNKRTEREEQTAYLETIDFFKEKGLLNEYEKELSWRVLKSKQELVLDSNRHNEFLQMFPVSHKYIMSCPYINKKLKIMMWLLTHKLGFILNDILKLRKILGR